MAWRKDVHAALDYLDLQNAGGLTNYCVVAVRKYPPNATVQTPPDSGTKIMDKPQDHEVGSGSCASPCSSYFRKHTILFTRDGGLDGVTDAAYCSFKCAEADGKMALSKAVTKWVETTDGGRAAWKESCEDFNIGDLACHQSPELLSEWGVYDLEVQVMAGAESWDYFDRHLVLPNNIDE